VWVRSHIHALKLWTFGQTSRVQEPRRSGAEGIRYVWGSFGEKTAKGEQEFGRELHPLRILTKKFDRKINPMEFYSSFRINNFLEKKEKLIRFLINSIPRIYAV
jgi:hypothetical protein